MKTTLLRRVNNRLSKQLKETEKVCPYDVNRWYALIEAIQLVWKLENKDKV